MPDEHAIEENVSDAVTAPVEPTETEAHEILSEAIDAAHDTADSALDVANTIRDGAEAEASTVLDHATDAIDSAHVLSTVQDAMDAHVREHHTEPVDEPLDETGHDEAVVVSVPPLDEIAPDVANNDTGGDVTVQRRRRVFGRSRRG